MLLPRLPTVDVMQQMPPTMWTAGSPKCQCRFLKGSAYSPFQSDWAQKKKEKKKKKEKEKKKERKTRNFKLPPECK